MRVPFFSHSDQHLSLVILMTVQITYSIDIAALCRYVDAVSLLQKINFEGTFVEQLTMDIRTIAQDLMVV